MKQLLSLLAVLCLLASGASAQSKTNFDINKATVTEIAAKLEGVGPKKAAAIVAYRKKHGALKTTDDLLQVPGLGPVLVAKNVKAFGLKRGSRPLDASSKPRTKKASKRAVKDVGTRADKANLDLKEGARKKAAAAKPKVEPSADVAKKSAKESKPVKTKKPAKAKRPVKKKPVKSKKPVTKKPAKTKKPVTKKPAKTKKPVKKKPAKVKKPAKAKGKKKDSSRR